MENQYLLSFILFLTTLACSSPFQKIPEEEVDQEVKNEAIAFAKEIMAMWKKGEAYSFSAENATPPMTDTFTPAMQNQASQQIEGIFGSFTGLSYADAWQVEGDPNNILYRMKGEFDQGAAEIRVAMTRGGKISGFWVKPWSEELSN